MIILAKENTYFDILARQKIVNLISNDGRHTKTTEFRFEKRNNLRFLPMYLITERIQAALICLIKDLHITQKYVEYNNFQLHFNKLNQNSTIILHFPFFQQ